MQGISARNHRSRALALALIFEIWTGAPSRAQEKATLTAPGVGNFHQVDDHMYRGAQPTPQGIKNLAKLGIKTVVDLRGGGDHSAAEEGQVKAAGMRYVSVPMAGLQAPSSEQLAEVFKVLDDSTNWPVFVHCKRGADRTGTVVACYRIRHDHWEKQKALTEARYYGMSWMERGMQQFILHFEPGDKHALSAAPKAPANAAPASN